MDLRNQEEDAEGETADARLCQTRQLTACLSVALMTAILVIGLMLCSVPLVIWMAEPDMEQQTSGASGRELRERLQQCHRESHHLNLLLQELTQDPRCSVCPEGWLWWRSHCYFFSVGVQENRPWNQSAQYCRQHNSSLAMIKDSAEMDFLQGVMRKFPQFPFLWVGLTDGEQEGRWLWWNGADVQQYMQLVVEWDADHRDCADLRGGGSLFAADCEAYGPWACKRQS